MTAARLTAIAAMVASAVSWPAAQAPPQAVETFDAAWTIVRETHFDPSLHGLDWDAVRRELRPRVEQARTMDDARDVVREMLERLGQSHFTLLSGAGSDLPGAAARGADRSAGLGLDLRLLDEGVAVAAIEAGGPAARAGVKAGWLMEEVDGVRTADALARVPDRLPPHVGALHRWLAVTELTLGPEESPATIVFDTGSEPPARLVMRRERPAGEPVTLGVLAPIVSRFQAERLERNGRAMALIRFNTWMTPVASQFAEAMDRLRDADGFVIDLRGNTGGVTAMVMGLAGHFLDEPVSLGTMTTRANALRFVVNPQRAGVRGQSVRPYNGPLAILVDELTYSTSEVFAAGLQALGRARVFGRRTGGGALPSLVDRLPNGDALLHAVADFTTPSGARLEARGVRPDETVEASRADLLAGRDRPLEAALDWLAAGRQTPGLPAARAVIDRHVAAIGGVQAIARHVSRHTTGTFELRQQGIAGTLEVFAARPAKQLVRIDVPGFGLTEAGFDGEVGWSLDPAVGPRLVEGRELERLRLLAEFDAALHDPAQYESLETVARTTFDGRSCLQVRVRSRSGLEWVEYYDSDTGLFAGLEGDQDTPMGAVTVTTTMGEYRPFGDLLLPTVSVQRVAGTGQEVTMTVTGVTFDEVDDAVFARPASITTLLRAR